MCLVMIVGWTVWSSLYVQESQVAKTERAMRQLNDKTGVSAQREMAKEHYLTNNGIMVGWGVVALGCFLVFLGDLKWLIKKIRL